eukprot:125168-Amphidinium_carterae.1
MFLDPSQDLGKQIVNLGGLSIKHIGVLLVRVTSCCRYVVDFLLLPGTLYRDDVWLGGVLLRIEFGVVNNACGLDGFVEAEYDGILGLGTSDGQQIGNVLIQELRRRK